MTTHTLVGAPWQLGVTPSDFELTDVRAVLSDAVLDDARVVVRDGLIAEVGERPAGARGTVSGGGALVLPGLVDVHSDALEAEHRPRPTAPVPWSFALASLEGKFAAAGVTTAFHGAAFQHETYTGGDRDLEQAARVCRIVDGAAGDRVDHRVLHRLSVLSAPGAAQLRDRLDQQEPGAAAPLVSHEDHTPGQGQYANPDYLREYLERANGLSRAEAEERLERLTREAQELAHVRGANLAWLGELAREGRIRLAGHDPDTAEAIDELHERGGRIAEFPTTEAAARRARELGMSIVAGAPNLLRGGSHSGNIAAEQLLATGLLDALASDYLPSALLGSVWRTVHAGVVDLPAGVRLVTAGPAEAAGLHDRGALLAGLRGDLCLVDDRHGEWPRVLATLRPAARTEDGAL